MKKPTKEKREVYTATYLKKNRERLNLKRRVIKRKHRNSSEVDEAMEIQNKNKKAFDKSFFGRELIKIKFSR